MNFLFNLLLEILGLVLLTIPLIWEVWNDKNGDAHISRVGWNDHIAMLSKRVDIYARCILACVSAWGNCYLTYTNFFESILLSGAIHFLLFDYIIAYILMKNRVINNINNHWFSYLGSKGMDNNEWWRNRSPIARFAIRVILFMLSATFYFY